MPAFTYQYGGAKGKKRKLEVSDEYLVVRTAERRPLATTGITRTARNTLEGFESIYQFVEAGVELLKCKVRTGKRALRDKARRSLKKEAGIQFAGRVLQDPKTRVPVVYTENFFLKFADDVKRTACRAMIKEAGWQVRRQVDYARNAYFVSAPPDTGMAVFKQAAALLKCEEVEFCHPELVRRPRKRGAFSGQWHLKKMTIDGNSVDEHANVAAAWPLSEGDNVTVAVIDDGVDLAHEEFTGAGKIVAPRDVTRQTNNPSPGTGDNHGTACAGVACANGNHGASGVAPKARLMPIRLTSGLGSQAEADAFVWAADHGADVISCSWGPYDGDFTDPSDPLHNHVEPLPDSTRLAIDYAIQQGRGGKGCVITWAAGNGGESADNDGYASYEKVIAVAACNDQGVQSPYSDYGDSVWCAFPSSNYYPSVTPGIWTTDRTGAPGYNWGHSNDGDADGNYTNSFGGTSSSCPGAAGVAALVIARNPELRWDQVKDVLKRCCEQIDTAGGAYDANGHSAKYGYGRLDAKKAVELAVPPQPKYTALHRAVQDVAIKDQKTSRVKVAVGDTKTVKDVKVHVDIEHTWIGDLRVRLKSPSGSGLPSIVLHERTGGSTVNLNTVFDTTSTPDLAALVGQALQGTWTLEVHDHADHDQGTIRSFALELAL